MNINITEKTLARKLVVYIMLCSILITLLLTTYQLYMDYSLNRNKIIDMLHDIEHSNLQAINRNLWTSNEEQLAMQIKGILELPDMQSVRIISKGITLEAGKRKEQNTLSRQIPLSFTFDGKEHQLGTLYLTATLDNVSQHLFKHMTYILLTEGVKIFLVAIFIFFILHYLITRHLFKIARFTKELDINNLDSPLTLDRASIPKDKTDELDQVVNALNTMTNDLSRYYLDLKQEITQRRRTEDELRKRTEELEKVNKAFVGRELRMAEMKKEMEELKKKIKS